VRHAQPDHEHGRDKIVCAANEGQDQKACFPQKLRPTTRFHEEKDVNYVSLVATATLGGQAPTPLMSTTTTDLPFKSKELAILRRTFAAHRTARG
jgi:hypothetical protein